MEDSIVNLNVGGIYFATRRSTLAQSDSFFSAAVRTHPDCAEMFVDRDPTHFRHVLNWLRGVRSLPIDATTLRELRQEADYYNMHDMVATIARSPSPEPSLVSVLCGIRDELAGRRPNAGPQA
jgi:hypothetical protein